MKSPNLCFKVGQCWVENIWELLVLQFGIKEFAFPLFFLLRVVDNDAVGPRSWEILLAVGTMSTYKYPENQLSDY